MIEYVRLWNFQRHEKLRVDFDPSVTTLVGDSDVGKSSVLRAVYWLCFNRPAGTDMVRHGSDKAVVVLGVDGHKVRRARGAAVNLYGVGRARYVAFGQGVPEEVAALLNVAEVNFQAQLDPPFWLADPPPKVSRELNAVVSLGVIDDTLSAAASQVRQAKAAVEVCQSRLERAREDVSNLSWVPAFVREVQALEREAERLARGRDRALALRSRVELARGIEQTRWRSSGAKADATTLESVWLRREAGRERAARLRSLVGEARRHVSVDVEVVDMSDVDALYSKTASVVNKAGRLRALVATAKREQETLWRSERSATQASKELAAVRTCPVCGSRLNGGR